MGVEEEGGVGWLGDDFDLVAWEDGSAFTEAGSPLQVERLRSSLKSRICEVSARRATGFDYRFSNDVVRFIAP